MLHEGFLRLLSDWVNETLAKDYPKDMEKSAKAFGLDKYYPENEEEYAQLYGVFSEWNVYDRRHQPFGYKTGLQFFTEHNPLSLPDSKMSGYRDLLDYEVGFFVVEEIEKGRGVWLKSVSNNHTFFLHDINTSLSVSPHTTLWGRVAPVNNLYHGIGCLLITMPVNFGVNFSEIVQKEKKNSQNARAIAEYIFSSPPKDIEPKENMVPYLNPITAAEEFSKALQACGMGKMFTLERFNEWLNDEKRYGVEFCNKCLLYLVPEDTPESKYQRLFMAGTNYMNTVPRSALKSKAPQDIEVPIEERLFNFEVYDRNKYFPLLEKAHQFMKTGECINAYKTFETTIQTILNDKTPYFPCFRIFTNTATSCLQIAATANSDAVAERHQNLGEAILRAALRINPQYEFGLKTQERLVNPFYKFTGKNKKKKLLFETFVEISKKRGDRLYARTPFAKYEKFLKEAGINLEQKTTSEITIYKN